MKKSMKNKKFLIITATHGDEGFSTPVIKRLQKEFPDKFEVDIGNPKALKVKKRYLDSDLNRVAPGEKASTDYEKNRAWEINNLANKYQFTIDIHGASSKCGLFTIVTNPTPANLMLAYSLPIKNIVIWGSKNNGRLTGPLSRFFNCGIGIECGPQDSPAISRKLFKALTIFCSNEPIDYQDANKKELYQVFGKLTKKEINQKTIAELQDFRKVKINGQEFYPLLVKQYRDDEVICYKMRKLNFYEKFSFPY